MGTGSHWREGGDSLCVHTLQGQRGGQSPGEPEGRALKSKSGAREDDGWAVRTVSGAPLVLGFYFLGVCMMPLVEVQLTYSEMRRA